MALYALALLDKSGNIVLEQPQGCQFDSDFLSNVVRSENQSPSPTPSQNDMGGGFFMHMLWSGIKPFIVLPEYFVVIVSDQNENFTSLTKNLRKITNNVLLNYKNEQPAFSTYMGDLWSLLEQEQINSIILEKPPVQIAIIPATPVKIAPKKNGSLEFDSLLELSNEVEQSNSQKQQPFTDNPFGTSSSRRIQPNKGHDPFGGSKTPANDPFGSNENSSDPFGSNPSTPINSNDDPHSASIQVNPKNTAPDPFNDNPFGAPIVSRSKLITANPFDDNPFGTPIEKGDPITQADDFEENIFGSPSPLEKKKSNKSNSFDDNPFA